jgi:crotonobetainyl-CoA:carnitine CoA-transferase CaiB-like acyl-CoA transferase
MNQKPEVEFLSSFRVLDLTNESGYLCAKILGDLGSEVIRVEQRDTKRDFWWWAYNSEKKVLHLDIEKEQEKLLQLVKEADFLVESFAPGYLDRLGLGYSRLKSINPRLIVTSITPFGQTGPYKDYKASDLELMALGGVMYLLGDSDRPPVRIGFPQAYPIASAEAAVGTLIAHCWRERIGEGQRVDVSAHESILTALLHAPYFWSWLGDNPRRTGPYRFGIQGAMFLHPLIWKCKNGHVAYMIQGGMHGAHSNRALVKYMEMEGDCPDFIREIKWEEYELINRTREELAKVWESFARLFMRHTTRELYQISLKERLQLFPVNTVQDILEDEQLHARDFWQERKIPGIDKVLKFPGPFARISLSPEDRKAGERRERKDNKGGLLLEGLRVADFSWVAAAPWATTWLAEYGAEVIKIESRTRPDSTRLAGPFKDSKQGLDRSCQFLVHNGSKKAITLNLNHPGGREIAKKLVACSEVVVESFSPGQMQKWGLGYEELRKINPRLIMVSASMMGATGPHAAQPGLGLMLTSLTGFTYMTGWPDRDPPFIWGAYTDVLASRLGGAIIFAALDYRRRTGKGCYIDIAQYEGSLQFISPNILEYQATGNLRKRSGNRSPVAAPHGAFPCRGEDRWCAISAFTDSEWKSLCKALGEPEWTRDPRFDTFEGRKKYEDELERKISDWTIQFTPEEVMTRLQKAGVQAGAVQTCSDLFRDPQLIHRKHFVPVIHAEVGEYDYFSSGFRLEKTPFVKRHAPCMGEHNEYVYKQILGMSDEELDAYQKSGALK